MKKYLVLALILTALCVTVISCGKNTVITKPNVQTSDAFGTDSTFDIVTWNIENYPKADPTTTDLLAGIIPRLNVDCICVEEVMNAYALSALTQKMPHWKSIVSGATSDYRLAFLYDTTAVSVQNSYTIFNNDSNAFPRPPLVVELTWRSQPMVVIVNHLKAMGDNVIDHTNTHDEEMRRLLACQALDQYITDNLSSAKVIVLGDMNDQIQETAATNVFTPFLEKPDDYLFTDMYLANHLTHDNCSYPNYNSQIDHILITNELFPAFAASGSYVRSIRAEQFVSGGWNNYDNFVSDHRPVGVRLKF